MARQRRSHYRQPYKFQVCMTIQYMSRRARDAAIIVIHIIFNNMPCNYKRNIKMYNRYRQMYKHVYIHIYIYMCKNSRFNCFVIEGNHIIQKTQNL